MVGVGVSSCFWVGQVLRVAAWWKQGIRRVKRRGRWPINKKFAVTGITSRYHDKSPRAALLKFKEAQTTLAKPVKRKIDNFG